MFPRTSVKPCNSRLASDNARGIRYKRVSCSSLWAILLAESSYKVFTPWYSLVFLYISTNYSPSMSKAFSSAYYSSFDNRKSLLYIIWGISLYSRNFFKISWNSCFTITEAKIITWAVNKRLKSPLYLFSKSFNYIIVLLEKEK
jgi:hypothetical protein